MKTKAEIIDHIKKNNYPNNEVAISLDDFFNNGNYYEGSIGVNVYPDPPTPQQFHQILSDLLTSNKASQVFIRITDIEEPEEWFYSDTVYIITDQSIDVIKDSLQFLRPDEIHKGWMYGKPANIGEINNTQKIFSCWWD